MLVAFPCLARVLVRLEHEDSAHGALSADKDELHGFSHGPKLRPEMLQMSHSYND